MNIGNNILSLRKQKNITQDALAAELGVTAAAVSKWEKGYTLPDILMLCALADYFEVTTDELLGRSREPQYAVVAASNQALAVKIQELASRHNIITKAVFDNKDEATAAVKEIAEVRYLIMGFIDNQLPDLQFDWGDRSVSLYLSISDTEQGILNDLHHSLQNNS